MDNQLNIPIENNDYINSLINEWGEYEQKEKDRITLYARTRKWAYERDEGCVLYWSASNRSASYSV